MYIGEVIKKYREEHNLSTRTFAEKVGLSNGYISQLERIYDYRTNKPILVSYEALKKIADGMNITIDNLVSILEEDQEVTINEDINVKDIIVVPVLGTIPAGIPIEAIEDIVDYEEVIGLNKNKEYFGLVVRGDSMEPEFYNGTHVILEKTETCENRDYCAVLINGFEATLKQVIIQENGIILQPLNPKYETQFFTKKQIQELPVTILGVVVESRRKYKKI